MQIIPWHVARGSILFPQQIFVAQRLDRATWSLLPNDEFLSETYSWRLGRAIPSKVWQAWLRLALRRAFLPTESLSFASSLRGLCVWDGRMPGRSENTGEALKPGHGVAKWVLGPETLASLISRRCWLNAKERLHVVQVETLERNKKATREFRLIFV